MADALHSLTLTISGLQIFILSYKEKIYTYLYGEAFCEQMFI